MIPASLSASRGMWLSSFRQPESRPTTWSLRMRAMMCSSTPTASPATPPSPIFSKSISNWIYIEDAATAIVAALERGRAGQGYNIVDDEPVRWRDFMTELAHAVGAPVPWSIPRWALRLVAPFAEIIMAETSLRVSNARARSELDWVPSVPTYREGIQRIVQALDVVTPVKADRAPVRSEW